MFDRITTFNDLKEYALRKLGKGALTVVVTTDQVTDRMYDAIEMFSKYHYDGFKWSHIVIPLTADIDTYILDDNILDVIEVLPWIDILIDDPTVNIQWEFYEDKIRSGNIDLIGFEALQQKLDLIDFKLRRQVTFSFNFSTHEITFYSIPQGIEYIALKVFEINDPENYIGILNNEWLRNYFTALLQIQFGENLNKYTDVPLPGGARLNASNILEKGYEEKEKLEIRLKNEFEEPVDIFSG